MGGSYLEVMRDFMGHVACERSCIGLWDRSCIGESPSDRKKEPRATAESAFFIMALLSGNSLSKEGRWRTI